MASHGPQEAAPTREPISPLRREFLTWISSRPRTYQETMEAWRTSCPRQSVWEDALNDGLVRVERAMTLNESTVTLTPLGRKKLSQS